MAEASRQPAVSCGGEEGQVCTVEGCSSPTQHAAGNSLEPPALTHCFLGHLQPLQPVLQFPGGMIRRSLHGHLQ